MAIKTIKLDTQMDLIMSFGKELKGYTVEAGLNANDFVYPITLEYDTKAKTYKLATAEVNSDLKYYKIDLVDFQKQAGDFDIITILDNSAYIASHTMLRNPFVKCELPESIQAQLKLDIENARVAKHKELENARDVMISSDIEFKGHIFQSNENTQNNLNNLITANSANSANSANFEWISKDNKLIIFTLQELNDLFILMVNKKYEAWLKCRKLKDKLELAQTLKEIQQIVF